MAMANVVLTINSNCDFGITVFIFILATINILIFLLIKRNHLLSSPFLSLSTSPFEYFLHFPLPWFFSSHSSFFLSHLALCLSSLPLPHLLSLSFSFVPSSRFTFSPSLSLSLSLALHDLVSSNSQHRHLGFGSRAREGMTPLLGGGRTRERREGKGNAEKERGE